MIEDELAMFLGEYIFPDERIEIDIEVFEEEVDVTVVLSAYDFV